MGAVEDVALGRTMVFRAGNAGRNESVRIVLVEVVKEITKIRVIHSLTFEGPNWGTKEGDGGRSTHILTGRRFPGASYAGSSMRSLSASWGCWPCLVWVIGSSFRRWM